MTYDIMVKNKMHRVLVAEPEKKETRKKKSLGRRRHK
jgi:hypothetical protein